MRRFELLFTAAIIAATCLPLSAMATELLDKGKGNMYAWVLAKVIDHENADGWAQIKENF